MFAHGPVLRQSPLRPAWVVRRGVQRYAGRVPPEQVRPRLRWCV